MKTKHYFLLLVCLLCAGCADIATPPAPTPLPAASPTPGQLPTATPSEGTKVPEPLPTSVTLESGYILSLAGGLTEAGRAQLEAGATGYFVLAYASRTALPTEGVEIGDRIDHGVFFGIVQPSALGAIQEQV
jgi:hypothetical protein